MDIESLYTVEAHGEGAEMQVIGPDGADTDVYLNVVGIDSTKWADIQREHRKKLISAAKDDNLMDDIKAGMLSQALIGWRGLTENGAPVEFSADVAKALLANAPYILDQLDTFIAKRSNFMKG